MVCQMTIRISIFNNSKVLFGPGGCNFTYRKRTSGRCEGRFECGRMRGRERSVLGIVRTKRCKTSRKWSRGYTGPPLRSSREWKRTGVLWQQNTSVPGTWFAEKWCALGRQFLNNWLESGKKWITVWSFYNVDYLTLM